MERGVGAGFLVQGVAGLQVGFGGGVQGCKQKAAILGRMSLKDINA